MYGNENGGKAQRNGEYARKITRSQCDNLERDRWADGDVTAELARLGLRIVADNTPNAPKSRFRSETEQVDLAHRDLLESDEFVLKYKADFARLVAGGASKKTMNALADTELRRLYAQW
jgi:hypothetical protein